MGSWLYAYLTPGSGSNLRARQGLCAMRSEDLEPDSTAIEVLPDQNGHCEPRGREFDLGADAWAVASALLDKDTDLLVMLRNYELYLSCQFARCARQPHIVLGWSLALFRRLSEDRRERYLEIVARFAEAAEAAGVVLVLEPPGYFEDRIVGIDTHLLVDAQLPNGRTIAVQEVWISGGTASVEGAALIRAKTIARYQRSVVVPGK